MDLRDKLIAKQIELGLSDAEMAARLGVERAMWAMIRAGQAAMGLKTLEGVLDGFPEFSLDVMRLMAEKAEERRKEKSA